MSVQNENASSAGETVVLERPEAGGVYASLFEKINLKPASHLSDINTWQDEAAMAEADANERITAGVQVFMDCIRKSGQQVEKLDKTLIDHHIAELDYQISRQLDEVLHQCLYPAAAERAGESLADGTAGTTDRAATQPAETPDGDAPRE